MSYTEDLSRLRRSNIKTCLMAVGAMFASALAVAATDTRAPDTSQTARPPKYYQQPTGFGGHQWNDPLLSFTNLPIATPLHVEASKGTEQPDSSSFHPCTERVIRALVDRCDVTSYVAKLDLPNHKRDVHLVMQYRNDTQGFRVSNILVLHPVTHFFCAEWFSEGGTPQQIAEEMKYCGVRLDFTSETTAELAEQPSRYVSRYEQLLKYLLRRYGPPYNYRGRVIVADAGESSGAQPGLRDFPARYRWCTRLDSIMAPKCNVRMVLTFDATTGNGSLLMATMPLQLFAQVQRGERHDQHGPLYYEILTGKTGDDAVGD